MAEILGEKGVEVENIASSGFEGHLTSFSDGDIVECERRTLMSIFRREFLLWIAGVLFGPMMTTEEYFKEK